MALSSTRSPRRAASIVVLVAIAAAISIFSSITCAEGFRIETEIYVGEEEAPASKTTTLFLDGAVYDFLEQPPQTAVFRKPGGGKPGRFILLNAERRIQTEVSTEKLAGAMTKLRAWAGRQKHPFLKFAADPQFEESFDAAADKLVLASHLENYTVTTTAAEHADALAEYREFLDWYAQLNTLLSGGPPPEPRLRLNEALSRHQVIPVKVELTRAGEEIVRAEHDFTWRLSRDDFERIDDVGTSLAAYRQVSNEDFLRSTEPPEAAK